MILIPAAGDGRRFREAGYKTPKHELTIMGVPMVDLVVQNVKPLDPDGFAFVMTQQLVGQTKGAVDTVLKGIQSCKRMGVYSETEPLVIANCDQLIVLPENLPAFWGNGLVFTFKSNNSAHSYVSIADYNGPIVDIVEKPLAPPSNMAVAGVYAFPTPGPFVEACEEVLAGKSDGELFISSALKVMIEKGYVLYHEDVTTAILGTPEDYQRWQAVEKVIGALS